MRGGQNGEWILRNRYFLFATGQLVPYINGLALYKNNSSTHNGWLTIRTRLKKWLFTPVPIRTGILALLALVSYYNVLEVFWDLCYGILQHMNICLILAPHLPSVSLAHWLFAVMVSCWLKVLSVSRRLVLSKLSIGRSMNILAWHFVFPRSDPIR